MKFNFLILDYNRPIETELCLNSIKKFAKFNYNIIYLSNGGDQKYVHKYYDQGLIDKLILRKNNSGCGLGTRELFNDFDIDSDYVFYIQCDQFMIRELKLSEIELYISKMIGKTLYVDLAGNQGNGKYSERAHFINKNVYNKIPNSIGGPGPFANQKWTEKSLQDYMLENDLKFLTIDPPVFGNNGKISYRQFPCGGETMHFTDTKQLWIIKPLKDRYDGWPNFDLTNEEWEKILSNTWENGSIPKNHVKDTFTFWQKPYEAKDLSNEITISRN